MRSILCGNFFLPSTPVKTVQRIGYQYADASNGIGLSIAKQLADEGSPWTAVQAMVADSSPVSAQRNGQPAPTTASRISLLKVIITAPVGNLAVAAETTMTTIFYSKM